MASASGSAPPPGRGPGGGGGKNPLGVKKHATYKKQRRTSASTNSAAVAASLLQQLLAHPIYRLPFPFAPTPLQELRNYNHVTATLRNVATGYFTSPTTRRWLRLARGNQAILPEPTTLPVPDRGPTRRDRVVGEAFNNAVFGVLPHTPPRAAATDPDAVKNLIDTLNRLGRQRGYQKDRIEYYRNRGLLQMQRPQVRYAPPRPPLQPPRQPQTPIRMVARRPNASYSVSPVVDHGTRTGSQVTSGTQSSTNYPTSASTAARRLW